MKPRRHAVILAAALTAALATHAAAQEGRRVAPGDRVRVSAPTYVDGTRVAGTSRWTMGRVREMSATAIVLQTDTTDPASAITIPLDVVREIEISQGRTSSGTGMQRGLGRGMLIGGGTALAYVGMLQILPATCREGDDECEESPYTDDSAGASARNVGIGLALGAALGAALGSQAREAWVPAAWRAPSVAVAPGAGGVSLSINLRF